MCRLSADDVIHALQAEREEVYDVSGSDAETHVRKRWLESPAGIHFSVGLKICWEKL